MKVKEFVSKPKWKHITWLWTKDVEWENDRLECGPFTTKAKDNQHDIVVAGRDRLKYIFKFGHLIYEHHANPTEPVVILGDCLALGHDQTGKTYGVWGWYHGTETVDKAWQESLDWGETAGYSIGGKKTEIECNQTHCVLTDPEILEVSKTKSPANTECTVHYINPLAKSMVDKAKESPLSYGSELHLASKNIEKKLQDRFRVDPVFDIDDMINTRKCVKEYVWGLQEVSNGLIKSDLAREMAEDYLNEIKTKVETEMEQELMEKMNRTLDQMNEKLAKLGEHPAGDQMDSGNVVLELLQSINDKLSLMSGNGDTAPAPGEPQENTPAPPPPTSDDGDVTDEEEEDDEEDEEDKKKEIEKSEDDLHDMGYPDGEEPDPEGPNQDDVTDEPATEKDDIQLPDGENPDPEGPAPEMGDEPSDKGDNSKDMDYPSDSEGVSDEISQEATGPESQAKETNDYAKARKQVPVVKKPEPRATFQELMKSEGFVTVRKDNRVPYSVEPDAKVQMGTDKGAMAKNKPASMWDRLQENKGQITVKK